MHRPPIASHALSPRIDVAIRAIAGFVAVAAMVYLMLAVWVGREEVGESVTGLGALALLGGALVASVNYLMRFARWEDILRRMSQRIPLRDNLRVYIGGLALTATPGKIGETIRSALLVRWHVPVGASLAALFIDRLTDLAGVLLLAAIADPGLLWWLLAALAVGFGIALRWAFSTRYVETVAKELERRHRLATVVAFLRGGMTHYLAAWRFPAVIAYVFIALVAYGIQGLVFAGYVRALWGGCGLLQALHIFATATLIGAASMLPGGLGAMELALIAQLHAIGMPLAQATAAAVAVRAVTLWFGILAGLVCLLWYRRRAAIVQ